MKKQHIVQGRERKNLPSSGIEKKGKNPPPYPLSVVAIAVSPSKNGPWSGPRPPLSQFKAVFFEARRFLFFSAGLATREGPKVSEVFLAKAGGGKDACALNASSSCAEWGVSTLQVEKDPSFLPPPKGSYHAANITLSPPRREGG